MGAAYLKGPIIHVEWKNGCTGKVGYASEDDTRRAVKARNGKSSLGKKLYPYACRHCPCWHVSTVKTPYFGEPKR